MATQATPSMLAGNDAQAQLYTVLAQYGLQSLDSWAWDQLTKGATPQEILVNIRQTPQWQQKYWMITARQKAGLPPISESDVQSYMDTAQQISQQYNLPKGFLSEQVIGQFIADDKSVAELQGEVQNAYSIVQTASPAVRQYAEQVFGVGQGDGALAAFFVDPNKAEPVLAQQAQAVVLGGTGKQYGLNFTQDQAMAMAQAGITQDRAMTGFSDIDKMAALFQTNVGDKGPNPTAEQAAVGEMTGNAQITDQVAQKLTARAAATAGKVGVEENPTKGFEGLGAGF